MEKILTTEQLTRLQELASSAIPKNDPLRGQGKVALELHGKGYSMREVAQFLTTNGIPVSHAAVGKFIKNHPKS